jgi:hypothetical protein
MRHSNHATGGHSRGATPLLLLALVVIGCAPGAVASTVAPSPATPVVTPDPHLKEPVTADQIYLVIAAANPGFRPSNATINDGPIVKRINADLGGWPLRITAYTSSSALRKVITWKAGDSPGRDEPPYTFAALNITVEYGPSSGLVPVVPDVAHQATAVALLGILDPLLWPIQQHSVMAIPARTNPPAPTASPTKPAKRASPVPSKKP